MISRLISRPPLDCDTWAYLDFFKDPHRTFILFTRQGIKLDMLTLISALASGLKNKINK